MKLYAIACERLSPIPAHLSRPTMCLPAFAPDTVSA